MTSSAIAVRPMRLDDIAAVLAIQAVCYTEIVPESATSLLAKLRASPSTCFVAGRGDDVLGYLISLPWRLACPPLLNAATCRLPRVPDCLYLHDLAVAAAGRGGGVGQLLVRAFLGRLRDLRFGRASLVSVQNSAAYWARYGFCPVQPSAPLQAKLASYGSNASYMELTTDQAAAASCRARRRLPAP